MSQPTERKLSRNEKRYLARHVCSWCEQRLDRDSCGDHFSKPCTPQQREQRRQGCLAEYKPRKRLAKP